VVAVIGVVEVLKAETSAETSEAVAETSETSAETSEAVAEIEVLMAAQEVQYLEYLDFVPVNLQTS